VSKQVNNILGQVLAFAFFVVMGATPLAILALGIVNFTRERARRATIVLQALAAMAIWTVLTFFIVMIFFMTVFEYPAYRSRADDLKSTAIFVAGGVIYFLTAGVLIYWTKRQTKRMPAMGVSC
jgi:protein-S-isoprenylcysteine O-methyltransferase Ste14